MNKIPVGQVISRAYAFTLGEIGTVIGLIWIPTVLVVVGSFLVQHMNAGQPMPDPAGPPQMPPNFGFSLLFAVVSLLLSAMIAVALTRQALGLRQGPAFAHVALGSEEFRVFGAFAILYLLIFLFALGIGIVAGIGSVTLTMVMPGHTGAAASGAIIVVAALAGICALIYTAVRLSFLMVPAAVNEGEFGLTRSWQLTQGNFWRIVGIACGTLLPIGIVLLIAESVILGPGYFALADQMVRDPSQTAKYLAQLQDMIVQKSPLLFGLGLLFAPLTNGLVFTPAAFAYQMVSGKVIVASKNVE
jgi:hypothetical protein